MPAYANDVFAPLDRDHVLERLAGGNETEVYWTDDRRYVVKLKDELGGDVCEAVAWARAMRAVAEHYTLCLGTRHTIPNYYVVARDGDGQAHALVLQPFVEGAQPLDTIDYRALSTTQRAEIAIQLGEIVRRAHAFYRATGSMPDLYGRSSGSSAERKRMRALGTLPGRLWSFLVQRNLLRSHNLVLSMAPECRIVLVDYDPVRQGRLYRLVYFAVRRVLLLRDLALLAWMRSGGVVW